MTEMSLQGRLADFTLEEILQLIALQQKTGLLLVDASLPMVLAFEQGLLVGYRDPRRKGLDPLEHFLKTYGFFSSENWEHIDYISRNSNLDLTEILVNEGLLGNDELAMIQQEAAQEHLVAGMSLKDGLYNFSRGRDRLLGMKGKVRIKVDGLLMEAVRRIDEMPGLQEKYGDGHVTVRRTETEADEEKISPSRRRVLSIVGDENYVTRIVSHAKMSEFDCLTTLESLAQSCLISVHAPQQTLDESLPEAKEQQNSSPLIHLHLLIPIVFISLFILAGTWILDPLTGYREPEISRSEPGIQYWEEQDQSRIDAALQLYARQKGSYPSRLDGLVDAGWIDTRTLERAKGFVEYRVIAGGKAYRLDLKEADTLQSLSR